MASHADTLRQLLAQGPQSSRALQQRTGLSQPTVSRALAALGAELVSIGAGRSIRYALRDGARGVGELPVYRVDSQGRIAEIGRLTPVRPEGCVMRQVDGSSHHSEGLPWWLADIRPQGFLGRAYALRHAERLGLPPSLSEWSDAHALRAMASHGKDMVGNLLLGEPAREQWLGTPAPEPLRAAAKPAAYAALAVQATRGEAPGSSAGGEQPKFMAYVAHPQGARHVLVKFSIDAQHAVARRWRDLLLAEHLALSTLREAGVDAAHSAVIDHGDQRFLELQRFDRVGPAGRRALMSLACLDDQFVGQRDAPWPEVVQRLVRLGHVKAEAAEGAALLFAFGTLIGNSDMHPGNLSFLTDGDRPCGLAPAYDMLPMGFAPSSSGALRDGLPSLRLSPSVAPAIWRRALALAHGFLLRLGSAHGLSPGFAPCLDALAERWLQASEQLERLGE